MTIRRSPRIIMYLRRSDLRVWYIIYKKENYSSIREVCRRGEFDNFYKLVKRC